MSSPQIPATSEPLRLHVPEPSARPGQATDFSYLNSETVYLRVDSQDPPTDDIRVRQALNAAIDREAFIGTVLPEGTELAVAMVPPCRRAWWLKLPVGRGPNPREGP